MKFEYDDFMPDMASSMSGHDRLFDIFSRDACVEDVWHQSVDMLAENLREITGLFAGIAPLVAASGDNRLRGEFECLTMPGAVYWFLEESYLELLHHYVEARVCIDATTIPITDEQRNEARRLYCKGYAHVMRMCVNLYDAIPGKQTEYDWVPEMIELTSEVYADLYKADPPMLSPMSPYFIEEDADGQLG